MTKYNCFKLKNKEESKEIKWCQLAANKDNTRPVLNGLRIDGEKTVATDGFRIHVIETPDALCDYDNKTVKLLAPVAVTPRLQEVEIIDSKFPDYNKIIDTAAPVFKIGISKKLLADLKNMPGGDAIVLEFTTETKPVKVTCSGSNAVAVIMPMHIGG